MIWIRRVEYEVKESPELAFTRLEWSVEKVDNLWSQLILNFTVDTNRPWVGTLNKDVLRFGITEPRGIFSVSFQFVVRGKIHEIEGGSRVDVRIGPGFNTMMLFLLIYLSTLFFIFDVVISTGPVIWAGLLWMTVPVVATILLSRKVSQVERKVGKLFDADCTEANLRS